MGQPFQKSDAMGTGLCEDDTSHGSIGNHMCHTLRDPLEEGVSPLQHFGNVCVCVWGGGG